jgi:hypothetical protein
MTSGFESHSRAQKKRARPQGARPKLKINYKVMKEKLFIQESDLGEILEALAEEAIKHSDKFSTHATIACDYDALHLRVDVRNKQTFKELVSKTYYIVRELENNDSVVDDTIILAIGKFRIQQEKEAQEESTDINNN